MVIELFPNPGQLLVVPVVDLFLFINLCFCVFNLLSQVQVAHVLRTASMSHFSQFGIGSTDISFSYGNLFKEAHLLIIDLMVLCLGRIKLTNEHVYLLAVLSNLIQAIGLELLLLKLHVLVLFLKVAELVL